MPPYSGYSLPAWISILDSTITATALGWSVFVSAARLQNLAPPRLQDMYYSTPNTHRNRGTIRYRLARSIRCSCCRTKCIVLAELALCKSTHTPCADRRGLSRATSKSRARVLHNAAAAVHGAPGSMSKKLQTLHLE